MNDDVTWEMDDFEEMLDFNSKGVFFDKKK